MRGTRRRRVGLIATLMIFFGVTATSSEAQDQVVLQLRWDHQAQFAGYYAALWQGFYEAAGIEVEIRSAFGPEGRLEAINEVVEGRADFGIGGADVMIAANNGSPVLIASPVFQHSGFGIVSRLDSRISGPADLIGLSIAIPISDLSKAELNAVLSKEGIDPDKIRWVEATPGRSGPQLLEDRTIDAFFGFWPSAQWLVEDIGRAAVFLSPSAYGVDFYGDSIFTSLELAEQNPDLVRRFTEASLAGWRYAVQNSREISDEIASRLEMARPVTDPRSYNRSILEELKSKVIRFPEIALGNENPDRWEGMFQVLAEAGLVTGKFHYLDYFFDPEAQAVRVRERMFAVIAFSAVAILIAVLIAIATGWFSTMSRLVAKRTAELSASDRRYSLAIEGTAAGVWEWDIATGLVDRSHRWHDMLGYKIGDLEASLGVFHELLHPDDKSRARTAIDRHLEQREPYDLEIRFRRSDNHYLWVHARGQAEWDKNGQPVRMAGSIIDVNDRIEATRQARKIGDRLNTVITSAPVILWAANSDGEITVSEGAALEALGLKSGELVGKNIFEAYRDTPEILANITRALEGEEVSTTVKIGETSFDVSYRPTRDEGGKISGVVGVSLDSSERTRAENEIRRSAAITENSSDMVAMLDANFTYLSVNAAFLIASNKTRSEVIGKKVPDLFGEQYFREVIKPNGDRCMAGEPVHLLDWIKLPDGTNAYIDATYSKFVGDDGQIEGFVVSARNLTKETLADEKFRSELVEKEAILEIASEGIITIDGNQNIQVFNQSAERMFGYTMQEITNQTLDQLIPDFHREAHRLSVAEFLRSGDSERPMNAPEKIVGLRKDGSEFLAEATISSFFADGRRMGTVVIRDVSLQAELEKRVEERTSDLNDALEKAQVANQAKADFLANTSHELRTPLNAIIGFSEMLQAEIMDSMTPKQHEYVGDIENSGRHLLSIIDDILDLSKIEAGEASMSEGPVNINGAVANTVRIVKERAHRGGLTLLSEVSEGFPLVRGDSRMIKQVLINLLTNAIKFTPPGGKICVSAVNGSDNCVMIMVADTGIGMRPEDIPTALAKFGQIDSGLDRKHAGTGLGLPLVVEHMRLHGGTIDIASHPGGGTTVTIHFPADRTVPASKFM